MTDNRKEALASALSMIEKQFGAGSVMKLGEKTHMNVETTWSGSIALDEALGGGYAKGRIIEIYGPESSGKTTLTLHAIAEVQRAGGTAAFVDAEHALDPAYAKRIGVDIDNLIISQPDYGEQALEIVDALVRSGAVDLIVVDSVAALTPKAEIEGNMGDSFMGLQARLMSQALRKVTGVISKSNCTVIFINQIRMKIGVMFGNPETTTGGNALKFYASQRLEIRRKEKLESGTGDDKEAFGNRVKVKIVKNKVAPPFREVEIDVLFNEGISYAGELLDIGVERGIIKKSGAFYSYGEIKLGQGRENARDSLKADEKMMAAIEKEVRDEKKNRVVENGKKKQKEEAREE
jgi:recombination protein RecA